MSQATDLTLSANISGTELRTECNSIFGALATLNRGSSRPSYASGGLAWWDDSANPIWSLKVYDGTDDITLGTLNISTNKWVDATAQQTSGLSIYGTDGGSTDAYAITNTSIPTPALGLMINAKINTPNTGAAGMNVNGTGAVAIKKNGSQDLDTGDLLAGQIIQLIHDGTYWQLLSPIMKNQTVNSQTGTSYTILNTDRGKLVTFSNASSVAVTLAQAGTTGFESGFFMDLQNRGAGAVTITPTTSTVDGSSSITLNSGEGIRIFSDGTNYFTQRGKSAASGITVTAKSSTYTAVAGDKGSMLLCTSTFTLSLTAAATLGNGWFLDVRNDGTGVITIDPNGSETIDLLTTMLVYPGEAFKVVCDGSNFKTSGRQRGWVPLASAEASNSTTIDFTSFFTSDFDEYIILGSYIKPQTDAVHGYFRATTNAGSSYMSTNEYTATHIGVDATSTSNSAQAQLQFNRVTIGNASGEGYSFEARLIKPSGSQSIKEVQWHSFERNTGGGPEGHFGSGEILTGSAVNGVRFLFSSGNIAEGSFKLFGVRK